MSLEVTDEQLNEFRAEYEAAFPQFNQRDHAGVYRRGGVCRQYLIVRLLRSGAYRVQMFVAIDFLPLAGSVLVWTPPPGLSRVLRHKHARDFPRICDLIRETVTPSVGQPLTDQVVCAEVLKYLWFAPELNVYYKAAAAGLLALDGQPQDAISWCEKGREQVRKLISIGADGLVLMDGFLSGLEQACREGHAKAWLQEFQAAHGSTECPVPPSEGGTDDGG